MAFKFNPLNEYGNPNVAEKFVEQNDAAPFILSLEYIDVLKERLVELFSPDCTVLDIEFVKGGYSYKQWYYRVYLQDDDTNDVTNFVINSKGVFYLLGSEELYNEVVANNEDYIYEMIKK